MEGLDLIFLGTTDNDGTGTTAKDAGDIINNNFKKALKLPLEKSSNFSYSKDDMWGYIRCTNESALTISLREEDEDTRLFKEGATAIIVRTLGSVTLSADEGVTINGATSIPNVNEAIILRYLGDDTWDSLLISTSSGSSLSATTTGTLTLISGNWSAKTQTLTVTGVTTTSTNLIVIESITMGDRWGAAKVYATGQAADEITFTCDTVPTENIEFKVTILK